MTTVVIVEDEVDIGDLLAMYCRQQEWEVFHAATGEKGLEAIRARQPDFVVLDVGLGGELNGFDVCRELRKTSQVPILFLTAREDEVDRVIGLELGADDYVTKPFSPREVIARIKAILRRGNQNPESNTQSGPKIFGDISFDLDRREVTKAGAFIDLASQEISLLQVFVENQGIALSRQQILDLAWGEDWLGDIRTVDVHVRQLRKKLGDVLGLKTVRGHGYRLD